MQPSTIDHCTSVRLSADDRPRVFLTVRGCFAAQTGKL